MESKCIGVPDLGIRVPQLCQDGPMSGPMGEPHGLQGSKLIMAMINCSTN